MMINVDDHFNISHWPICKSQMVVCAAVHHHRAETYTLLGEISGVYKVTTDGNITILLFDSTAVSFVMIDYAYSCHVCKNKETLIQCTLGLHVKRNTIQSIQIQISRCTHVLN